MHLESIHCAAHCLQLCILAGFSITAIDRLLSAAKETAEHFYHSVVTSEALKQKQIQAEDLVTIFESFSTITTFFSYEENVSLSAVFSILHGILDKLATSEPTESAAIK